MRRGRKKTENPATARRILAAAEQQFAEQGLAGARTGEIAEAARANKAMLHYYFGTKERLHRMVLENLFRQLREAVYRPLPRAATATDKLFAWFNGYFDFLASHPNYQRLVQREAMETTPRFEWIVREYFRPFHRQLSSLIEEGVAAREFRKVDPQQTVFTLLGMTAFYFTAARAFSRIAGQDLLSPQALSGRRRAVVDFLEHGLLRNKARTR
jgi:AcrR family transcriptional regulator